MSQPVILTINCLNVRYGTRLAVDSLSMNVRAGEIVGMLGPNGSGKSSTLAAVAGCLEPDSGIIEVAGRTRAEDRLGYARRVGYVPQEPALYEDLSVRENMRFFASLYDLPSAIVTYRVERCLERFGLTDRARCKVRTLSGGLQRRVHFAVALLHDPKLLLLDEPTVALDPESREKLWHLLMELKDEGRAVLMCTHLLEEAEQWCDWVAVLRDGRAVAEGTPASVAKPTVDHALMYGHIRDLLPPGVESMLIDQMPADVELEITGRRIRLSAPDSDQLARALTVLLNEGITLDSFRTPPGRLDRLMVNQPFPTRSAACDVHRLS